MLKNSEEEKKFQLGLEEYRKLSNHCYLRHNVLRSSYEESLRKCNSPIIKDRDAYKIKNKDNIMRYGSGLELYRQANMHTGKWLCQIIVEYDKIFTMQLQVGDKKKLSEFTVKRTEYHGIHIEFFNDEELPQIHNNIDEDYMIRNKRNLPHTFIKRDRQSTTFADDTLNMYEAVMNNSSNESTPGDWHWRSKIYNSIYDWKVDTSMTQILPRTSQIKEAIFVDIIHKYTKRFQVNIQITMWHIGMMIQLILMQYLMNILKVIMNISKIVNN